MYNNNNGNNNNDNNNNNNNNNNNDEYQNFLEEIFLRDFDKHFLKRKLLLWKKLYCIQQVRYTAKLDKF